MARFARVQPVTQLAFETVFLVAGAPAHRVRKLAAVVLVTVALTMTAETPVAGTPALPVTWKVAVAAGPSALPAPRCPLPARVSTKRCGNPVPTSPPAEPEGGA